MIREDREFLANYLARQIFKLGDEASGPAQRMEYKIGKGRDNERAGGGLCEAAMASFIASMLIDPPQRSS